LVQTIDYFNSLGDWRIKGIAIITKTFIENVNIAHPQTKILSPRQPSFTNDFTNFER
jgi:hypothetical protein